MANDAKIQGLRFELSASSDRAVSVLERLRKKLKETADQADAFKRSFDDVKGAIDSAADSAQNYAKAQKAIRGENAKTAKAVAGATQTITKANETIDESADEAVDALDKVTGHAKDTQAELRKLQTIRAFEGFGRNMLTGWGLGTGSNAFTKGLSTIGTNVLHLADSFAQLGRELPEGPLKEFASTVGWMSGMLGKATTYSAKFVDSFMKIGGGIIGRISNQIFGNIRNVMSAIESLRGLVARRAVTMAIRSAIKAIISGLKEGIENLYEWSRVVDQTFYNTMNTLSTAGLYLKNSLAAALSPVIQAITPIIDAIINQFVNLVNVINQVLSILTGKSYWTKAVKVQAQFGDAASKSMGKTGKAAKQAKKDIDLYLASFDELHVMNAPKDSGSSGGGGGGGGAGGGGLSAQTMFQNQPFDQALKDLIESGDWYRVGSAIADKMNVVTDSIDKWFKQKFEPWAIKFGTNLGNTINGFVDRYDWKQM